MRPMDGINHGFNRRQFLSIGAASAAAALLPKSGLAIRADKSATEKPGSFDFLFLTDTHLEPELDASKGCDMAFRKAATMRADFAIQGGDHVFDSLGVDRKRADSLFDLYAQTEQSLGLKVHHTIGNHDQFGLFTKSGVEANSPGYGKQLFKERLGPTYYSFDSKGYHFVVLDTVQPTEDRNWEARIDAPQLGWLAADLAKLESHTPIVVTGHVPLVTAFNAYTAPEATGGSGTTPRSAHPQLSVANAYEVLPILEKYNVLAVLQGHTHINEVVNYHGIEYITSGAVCGNWWHGTRMGTPEGFTVVSLREGKLTHRYETYGFKTIDPQNT
jgi:3',5'-cyclic-AMP phosphodiesterase